MIWLKLQSLLPGQLGVSKTGMVPSFSFFFFIRCKYTDPVGNGYLRCVIQGQMGFWLKGSI